MGGSMGSRRGSWVCVVDARPRPCPEALPISTVGVCVCVPYVPGRRRVCRPDVTGKATPHMYNMCMYMCMYM